MARLPDGPAAAPQMRAARPARRVARVGVMVICSDCAEAMTEVNVPFDYTDLAGFNPTEYRVELFGPGIRVWRCPCGDSPEILDVTAVRAAIATLLVPPGSAVQYVRKAMGMRVTVQRVQ